MRESNTEVIRKEQSGQEQKDNADEPNTVETAVITISMGEGISELFKSMGATHY